MKHLLLLLLFLTTSFIASSQETHVFLLAGQSNMVGRADFDGGQPYPPGTLQWNSSNNTLVPASSPMLHHDARAGDMGLDVQFAIDYIAANPTVTLVLIPRAKGGTGFNTTGQWRVGDALYNSAVNETNACMAANPSFIFKGILWHQGERDRNNIPAYYNYYDNLINSMRIDINAADNTTPFVCGGLMPDFINNNAGGSDVELVQAYNEDTPNRIQYTAYAANTGLTTFDGTHGDAASLRVFGTRYFQQLSNAVNNACAVTTEFIGGSWTNGNPDNTKNTIIRSNYDITASNLEVCSCELTNNAVVTVGAGKYLKVEEDIVVNSGSTLIIEHTGSVVQTNDAAVVTNNGTINVELTTPTLNARDFMILGSPMTGETRGSVWNSAFLVLDANTGNFVPHPDVEAQFPGAENFADDNNDFWTVYGAGGSVTPGEGYLVRPQAGYGQPGGVFNYTYDDGTLNTGDINFAVTYNTPGPTSADNKNASPNVLANPYPSSIFANDFINANAMVDEVYFWEHLTPPSAGLPGAGSMNFSMEDISMYNLSGGVGAGNPEVIGTRPNGYIATGQGFGVKAKASGTATFTNAMRRTDNNNTLRNQNDKDRIWLNIVNERYEMGGTTMIAFNENATPDVDNGYDSTRLATIVSLYSHLEDGTEQLGIQTREAFADGLKVPLGFSSQLEAELEYKISISTLEGANLEYATVYLIDNYTNTATNLSEGDYVFTSNKGTFHNRFTVLFEGKDLVLGYDEFSEDVVSIFPNPTDGAITIISSHNPILKIEIYNVLGIKVNEKSFNLEQTAQMELNSLNNTSTYFVKVTTANGTATKRVVKY